MTGVPWRRAILAVVAAVLAVSGVVVALRADGYPAIDATTPRATRWFVDESNARAVLADGFSGQTLARLDVPGELVEVDGGSRMHVYSRAEHPGEPTLVFLAGMGLGSSYYELKSVWEPLSEDVNIATVDYLGYDSVADIGR